MGYFFFDTAKWKCYQQSEEVRATVFVPKQDSCLTLQSVITTFWYVRFLHLMQKVEESALAPLLLNDWLRAEALTLAHMLPRPLDLLMTIIREKPPHDARQSD